MADGTCGDRAAQVVLMEHDDKLILGVAVPLAGPLTEPEREAARLLFELALDMRVKMGGVQ